MAEPREFTLEGVEIKGRVFSLDEVTPWTEPDKPREFDSTKVELWKPPVEKKRRVFSLEEAKEAEAKRLIDIQKKILYQFSPKEIKERMDTYHPKNWKADYQYTMNQHWAEKYGYGIEEIFSKEFWNKTFKINLPKAIAMTYEMSYGFKERWGKRGERTILKYGSPNSPYSNAVRGIMRGEETGDPIVAGAKETARSAWDIFAYAPVTAWKLYKNPYKTIQEDFLDVGALLALVLGVKVAKGVMGKVTKAQKMGKPVFMSDVLDPLKGTPNLGQAFKRQLKSFPDVAIESIPQPLEIVKPMGKGQAPIFRHQIQRIIKDIAKHGDIKDRPMLFGAKTKKGFLNIGFRIPLRVFEKYKGFRSMLYDKARHGGKLILDEKATVMSDLKRWKKLGVDKGLQKEVGTLMTSMQKDGMQLLADMGVEVAELSNPKLGMRYMKWLRGKYDNYLGRINQVRTEAGLKPLNIVDNYATWIRNLHKLSEAGIDIAKADARTIKHVMAMAFKYAKKRKPGAFLEGIELDAGLVYQTYSNAAIEHITMTPVIAQTRALLKPFKMSHKYLKEVGKGKKAKMVEATKTITFDIKKDAPRWAAWLSEWSDTIAGVHKAIPKSKVGKYYRAMRGLQRNIAVGVLGWNVRSALIQPTALRLSYVMLGENNTMWGFWKNFTSGQSRKFALAESKVLQGRITNYSMDIHTAMIREAGVGRKMARTKQSVAMASMKPLQLLDFETARASWLGAYHLAERMFGKASKGGKILNRELHRACVRWADDVVTKTQASAAIWDIAPIQRTIQGKFLTMFQTFVINEFDFLTSDLFHYKNPYINMGNVGGNISRLVLATGVINAIAEGFFKIRSPYPAPITAYLRGTKEGKTALQLLGSLGKEAAETLPVLGSSFRWSTAWKSTAPAGFQVGFLDPLQMMNRLLNKPKLTTDQLEWLAKVIGVPGASQAAKFHRRIRRGQNYYQALLGVREEAKGKKKKIKKLTTSGW